MNSYRNFFEYNVLMATSSSLELFSMSIPVKEENVPKVFPNAELSEDDIVSASINVISDLKISSARRQ